MDYSEGQFKINIIPRIVCDEKLEEIMLFRQGLNKQRNLPKEVLIAYKFCGQKL